MPGRHTAGRARYGKLDDEIFCGPSTALYWRDDPTQSGIVGLVGDAAGHVKGSTVGGIVTGFLGPWGSSRWS